jgi:hypothetical protein
MISGPLLWVVVGISLVVMVATATVGIRHHLGRHHPFRGLVVFAMLAVYLAGAGTLLYALFPASVI